MEILIAELANLKIKILINRFRASKNKIIDVNILPFYDLYLLKYDGN